MAGVGLTGKIVPLNAGNFPVFEDINGQGGYRSVPTLAARNTLTSSPVFCKRGMLVFVEALRCVYMLGADLISWSLFASDLDTQAQWFISSTGNDNNDGLTPATALQTTEQLCARLCPRGALYFPKQPTTISLSGTFGAIALNMTASATSLLSIVGTVTPSAPITLAAGTTPTNAAANTRGQLVTAAGVFARYARIRVLTGAAAGAITYCNGLNGDPQHAFVKQFYRASDGSTAFPAVGDQVVTEVITSSLFQLSINGSAIGPGADSFGNVAMRDLSYRRIWLDGSGLSLSVEQCLAQAGSDHAHSGPFFAFSFVNCANESSGQHAFRGSFINFTGQAFQGTSLFLGFTNVRVGAACAADGTSFVLNGPNGTTQTGYCVTRLSTDFELQNGTGINAVAIGTNSSFIAIGRMWGGASPFAAKAVLASGGWFYYQAAANITFGSAVDFQPTGHTVPLAGTPIGYPRANCGVALLNDPAAVGQTT